MTIEEIHEERERRGEEKAETTAHHHVNVPVVREMKPCEYCETPYEEFLLRESFDPFSP